MVVERMNGAGWISVEAHSYQIQLEWLILYPHGRSETMPQHGRVLRQRFEEWTTNLAIIGLEADSR
jgi:hypothetical protein